MEKYSKLSIYFIFLLHNNVHDGLTMNKNTFLSLLFLAMYNLSAAKQVFLREEFLIFSFKLLSQETRMLSIYYIFTAG